MASSWNFTRSLRKHLLTRFIRYHHVVPCPDHCLLWPVEPSYHTSIKSQYVLSQLNLSPITFHVSWNFVLRASPYEYLHSNPWCYAWTLVDTCVYVRIDPPHLKRYLASGRWTSSERRIFRPEAQEMKLAPFPFLVYTSVDLTQYLHMHHLHAKLEMPVK
jgi:hypothetical protein